MIFEDKEWEAAENSNEERKYYFVETQGGGRYVKYYKPALASLVSKRTKWKMKEVK